MTQIQTGSLSPTQQDCVFLWLYCLDGTPYKKYLPGEGTTMPMVFAILRWDGLFGTLGGKVDSGETLLEALVREAREEAAFDLTPFKDIKPLGTFCENTWHIHSFAVEVSFEQLVALRANASSEINATAEVAGFCIVPAGHYTPSPTGPRGIEAFCQNQFCATAGLELSLLRQLIEGQTV